MLGTENAFMQPSYGALLQYEAAQNKLYKSAQASSNDSMPRSELTAEEYATDEFRMFHFKVTRCCKRFVHDWRDCPFAHSTENARRRDPRECGYLPISCPNYKGGFCLEGDNCLFAHGVYECWLHPAKYRTQMCKDTPGCTREVCFFAHSPTQLRRPHLSTAKAEREVFAKLGVTSLNDLGVEDWGQLLSPSSPNAVSSFSHFDGSHQDQAMAPVLQQYLMQQKSQQAGTALPRAGSRPADTNRPRMSNAMARHLGIIPGKSQHPRPSGDLAALTNSLTSIPGHPAAPFGAFGMPQQGFYTPDAFAPMPMYPGMTPSVPMDHTGFGQANNGNDLLQLANQLNYFNLSNQAYLQQQAAEQAFHQQAGSTSLPQMGPQMGADLRMPMDYSMSNKETSFETSSPNSVRTQLATCLGFPASGSFPASSSFPASGSERSASLMSNGSTMSENQAPPGFGHAGHSIPIQKPRRNATGNSLWFS